MVCDRLRGLLQYSLCFLLCINNKFINSLGEYSQGLLQSVSMMHQLLNDQELPKLTSNFYQELFPIAKKVPQPLNYNLVSQRRVIKQVKNSQELQHNILRGFYYQLFKLCFDKYDHSKNYLQITKSIIFDRSIIRQDNESTHYYKHIAQFISLMQNQQSQSFQQILSHYNEIDDALLFVLQQFLQERISTQQKDRQIETVLNDLCQIFEINLIVNHPYYQFQQSNVYLFIFNESQCYLVFSQDEEQSEKSNNVSQISVSVQSKNPSHITENNLQNDGNFTKEYTFQPQLQQPFQYSNKISEVSISIYSKQCNSRPVSNLSYKSHLSNESEYKRQQIQNRYEMKAEAINQLMYYPQKQSPQDPFKKGILKISNPYQISSPFNQPQQSIHYDREKKQEAFNQHNINGKKQQKKSVNNLRPHNLNQPQYGQSEQPLQRQDSQDLYPTFTKKINRFDPVEMMEGAKSVKSINEQNNSDSNTNSANNSKTLEYSISERQEIKQSPSHYQSGLGEAKEQEYVDTPSLAANQYRPQVFDQDQSIFYKPKQSSFRVISEMTVSKQSIKNNNQDSKGSIYRQFSDTRILRLLKQPHKTRVQIVRNRFKGQRFKI